MEDEPADVGFFVWGTEGDGPVDIEALCAELARNEGAFCLVTNLVSGGIEAVFSGAAVSCRGSGICFRRLEPLGVVRAVLLGAFSLRGDFSRLGTCESIARARVSGRPPHFQYHSGLLYRKYEPEVWNLRWIDPCSPKLFPWVATSLPRLHYGIWNQEQCDIPFGHGTYWSVDSRGRSASGHCCEECEEGGLWDSSTPVESPTSQYAYLSGAGPTYRREPVPSTYNGSTELT